MTGIGVATASAILCCLSPELVPFMADEVIEVATASGKRDYSMKTYVLMRESLIAKAAELGEDWTPEAVGVYNAVCMYVCMYVCIHAYKHTLLHT